MGLKLACAIMVIASATCLAVAQAAENLAVTESKLAPEEALQAFVRSYAAPAPVNGKMTRWKAPLCPVATGLPPEAGKLVTDRLKQVAGIVGAPAAKTETCKPNVDIVFTLDPQALLDEVRKTNPILLGYHDPAQQQRLATVTHPVQSWYTTQTVDINGATSIDERLRNRTGFSTGGFGSKNAQSVSSDANVAHSTASRIVDSLSSELFHVIVVFDLAKIEGLSIGALADYAAMLSLAQTQAFETCQPLPTIANLVTPGCDAGLKAASLTANDLAFLHGLYRINPRSSFRTQQGDVLIQMKKWP